MNKNFEKFFESKEVVQIDLLNRRENELIFFLFFFLVWFYDKYLVEKRKKRYFLSYINILIAFYLKNFSEHVKFSKTVSFFLFDHSVQKVLQFWSPMEVPCQNRMGCWTKWCQNRIPSAKNLKNFRDLVVEWNNLLNRIDYIYFGMIYQIFITNRKYFALDADKLFSILVRIP